MFIVLFVILSSSVFSKCEPSKEGYMDLIGFRKEELDLACSNPKPGDLIATCNGEACGVLTYPKAVRDVNLHEKPDLNSPVVGNRKRCEVIKDFKYFSIFREFGVVEALTDIKNLDLKKGDKLKYIWTQEGSFFGCIKGKPVVIEAYYERDLNVSCFYEIKDSKLEDWVRHTASNGKTGYSKVESNSFFIPYGGYDESLLCPEDIKKIKKDEPKVPPLPKAPIDSTDVDNPRTS